MVLRHIKIPELSEKGLIHVSLTKGDPSVVWQHLNRGVRVLNEF